MTQTALALNARDYKGLSGGTQEITIAAMCLQSTRDVNRKSEILQTASNPERTEDSAEENRKVL